MGIPLLDEQHKELFQWFADLENAAAEKRTLFGVYVITRLKHYMRDHFAAEEALMRAADYPRLEQHIHEHAAFRTKLGELHLKSIGQDISSETVNFLKEWLVNHIARSDMDCAPYLKQVKK